MTTRTNTARAGSGATGNQIGKATPSQLAVKKELSPYKPLPIPPTFDLDLDSQQLKEAITKLGYDPQGKIPTSLLVRPEATSSIPGNSPFLQPVKSNYQPYLMYKFVIHLQAI